MAKRMSAEVKILSLFDALSDDGKRIVFDIIKHQRQPAPKSRGKSPAPTAPKRSSVRSGAKSSTASIETGKDDVGSVVRELAKATGRSVEAAQEAYDLNDGDKRAAMLVLTSA